jgi:hypothetical protein
MIASRLAAMSLCHSVRIGATSGSTLGMASLKLPGGEAADVNMELVQPGIVAVAGELDLELLLALGHGAGRTPST